MRSSRKALAAGILGVLAIGTTLPAYSSGTKFTMTCAGDGSGNGANETFTCTTKMKHANKKNNDVPNIIHATISAELKVETEQKCPTWVFKNGQWVQICKD